MISSVPGGVVTWSMSFVVRDDVPPHVDDILSKMPKFVWMQLGIRNRMMRQLSVLRAPASKSFKIDA